MAKEKYINGRLVLKHDTQENWEKATSFIPLKGEMIIYDPDDTHTLPRFKIGDGSKTVNNLPFAEDYITPEDVNEICGMNEIVVYSGEVTVI